jgi:transglutaminase-like putative cysteine protease
MSAAETSGPVQEPVWREPLLLRVNHLTRFRYNGDTWDSFNEGRLQPANDTAQTCEEFELRLVPDGNVREYPDFYANCVHYFDVQKVHQSLDVEAISLVQTRPDDRGDPPAEISPEALKDTSIMESHFEFLQDSTFVTLEATIWREAMDALPQGITNLWEDAVRIGRHVFERFTYTPSATTVNTRPREVLKMRRGVCQDFAHVMLGMCRSVGLPARYASGYFYNPHRLPDEIEASHAWVEVYLPGYGWKGFDPTHNRAPDTRYIKLAVGRDYGDIRPISGSFRGKGTREMSVEVRVRRVEATV